MLSQSEMASAMRWITWDRRTNAWKCRHLIRDSLFPPPPRGEAPTESVSCPADPYSPPPSPEFSISCPCHMGTCM